MASRGQTETEALKKNVEEQMERLIQQLSDLESYKSEMEAEEYEEERRETLEQLREFGERLERMRDGNLSLVDHLNNIQLAIQAAVSEAFRTPEVILMFANRQHSQLRTKLAQLDRDLKVGKLPPKEGEASRAEVLLALKRLGEVLSADENAFLKSRLPAADFEAVSQNGDTSKVMAGISAQVKTANSE